MFEGLANDWKAKQMARKKRKELRNKKYNNTLPGHVWKRIANVLLVWGKPIVTRELNELLVPALKEKLKISGGSGSDSKFAAEAESLIELTVKEFGDSL